MEENKNAKSNELDVNDMEKVSGGCFFYHNLVPVEGSETANVKYSMMRCSDCGQEMYFKNDEEISRAEYLKERGRA